MLGRIVVGGLLVIAIVAGIAMYYLQVYAFYEDVPETSSFELTSYANGPEPIEVEGFRAIDSDSSPVRFRACFDVGLSIPLLTETYVIAEAPEPLLAPAWFDCFDAVQIGADLESGAAFAFMSREHVSYGIDRIVAIYDDGRAYAWTQINACGEVVFDGDPVPDGCPEPPERLQ